MDPGAEGTDSNRGNGSGEGQAVLFKKLKGMAERPRAGNDTVGSDEVWGSLEAWLRMVLALSYSQCEVLSVLGKGIYIQHCSPHPHPTNPVLGHHLC